MARILEDDDQEGEQVLFGPAHRLFMQTMIARHMLSKDDATKLCSELSKQTYMEFIRTVNKRLLDLDLTLKQASCINTGNPVVILINTKADETAKLSSSFTIPETIYFREIVLKIN